MEEWNKKFEICREGVGFSLDDERGNEWAARLEDDGLSVFGFVSIYFYHYHGKAVCVRLFSACCYGYCGHRRLVCFVSLISILKECT